NDKENKAPHSRDADKKRKVAEEAHEAHLRKVAEETHEELEARLVAEEEAQCAHAHKKYLLRKSRETPQQRIARLSKNRTTLCQRRDMEGVSTSDQKLLHKFRNIISNLRNNLYIMCNERFPSIVLAGEEFC
ncbi:5009_t:CDS:2, partial [Funneliformis caledonium]